MTLPRESLKYSRLSTFWNFPRGPARAREVSSSLNGIMLLITTVIWLLFVFRILKKFTVERRRELPPSPCPCSFLALRPRIVRTLVRWGANQTSTKYGHSIGGASVRLVRGLESQVVGAC
ncbi:hypothetical protein OUZ56_026168 [Daphnia magna]|uniref:Uncharacterized protein n=1 Tax=Daphnia magna TaxID=35525 RepID=A0ABQ9ZLZ2_9CRUS|nr:hypothetical protein OUZ56_026168 [Daphnia magna]